MSLYNTRKAREARLAGVAAATFIPQSQDRRYLSMTDFSAACKNLRVQAYLRLPAASRAGSRVYPSRAVEET
jgi:hypothetical protein